MALVIGFGNPMRQDDGLGFHAVAALREAGVPAELLHVPELVPELAERVATAEKVVFLGATSEIPPGEMACRAVGPAVEIAPLSHGLSPGMLLLYARRLHGRAPLAVQVSVGGEGFGTGASLSPRVQALLPRVLGCVLCILQGDEQGLVQVRRRHHARG